MKHLPYIFISALFFIACGNSIKNITGRHIDTLNRDAFFAIIIAAAFAIFIYIWQVKKLNKNKNALNEANETGFKIMSSMNEIETVIPEAAVQKLAEIVDREFQFQFNMHIPFICLYDEENDSLKYSCGKELPCDEYSVEEKSSDMKHLSMVCFKKKKEIYIDSYQNDNEPDGELHINQEASTVCFLPLRNGRDDKPIGVISIQSKRKIGSYQRLLFRTISSYVAIALDTILRNVSLIEDWAVTDTHNSIIRHEIRPKIQIEIPDYLEGLKNALAKNNQEDIHKELNRLIGVSDSLVQIVNTLSATAVLTVRKLPVKLSSFDIRIIFSSLEVMKRSMNQNVELIFDMEKPYLVVADKVMIELLLRTLIQNAINHTRQGSITVSASEYENDKDFIQVCVKDTGEGISDEMKKTIFSISDRAKIETGHGFGLVLCQHIVKMHTNSKIGVESKINEGSTFYFTLRKANIMNKKEYGRK